MAEAEKRATVLVVDDEHGVRQSFYMVLKDEFTVLLAGSGNEAIDIFSKNAVDLILLDFIMPLMTGLDFLIIMRSMPEMASIPVIFVTTETKKEWKESNSIALSRS